MFGHKGCNRIKGKANKVLNDMDELVGGFSSKK